MPGNQRNSHHCWTIVTVMLDNRFNGLLALISSGFCQQNHFLRLLDFSFPFINGMHLGKQIHTGDQSIFNELTGNLPGLTEMAGVTIIGGVDNPAREGLVCFSHTSTEAEEIVAKLNAAGVRTHVRKADHYSGNVLTPLGMEAAVRVSLCHYNSLEEVAAFLGAMKEILV